MDHSRRASALTIEQQHTAVLECCDELLAALQAGASVEAVSNTRMKLAGLLQANLASEELQFIGPIRRMEPAKRPRGFVEICEVEADLRSRYSAHVREWSPRAIEDNPAGYMRAAGVLVGQVKAHLNRKRELLPEWQRSLGNR